MTVCPGIADWESYAQESAPAARAGELVAHLDTCTACQALLSQIRRNDAWLEQMRSLWEQSTAGESQPVPVGRRIGRYEITGLLGSGGMATVYSARQDSPQRTVALKVLRPGWASPNALRRLQQEAELLGRLQHPGIGRIYEAGYAELDGVRQPFFAMELVEGQRLTEFAERHRLSTRERLVLMAKIGEAVHFAHQRGVIHRDLKPSNILVVDEGTEQRRQEGTKILGTEARRHESTRAQPKILDFGVACCTDSDVQVTTLHTAVGQLVGTIPYMSPEQAAGNPLGIDVRSDVYALGVVTYELLTGRLPYDVSDKGIAAAIHVIQEQEPMPLSQANRTLRGDVETIVAKALEKDKTRRYNSAADFVADVRRFLNDEPISARPPSATYQLAKFAKRNKALVTGVAGVFVALLAGLIGAGVGLVRATAERNRALDAERIAETRRAEAQTVIDLLSEMIGAASPDQVKGADYTVRQLLDDFAKGLDGRFPGQPEVEATIRAAIGNAYGGLGLRPQGEVHLKAALALRREALGPEHPDTARSLVDYARWLECDFQVAEAERTLNDALRIQRRALGAKHPATADTLARLAEVLHQQEQYGSAEIYAREALATRRELLGQSSPEVAKSLLVLGTILRETRRCDEAKSSIREALAIWRTEYGDRHPLIAKGLQHLALTLQKEGDAAGAEEAFGQSLAIGRAVLGAGHHDVAMILSDYGTFLNESDRYREALPVFNEALQIQRRVHGDEHLCLAYTVNRLCVLLSWSGDYAAAEPICREGLSLFEAVEPEPRRMVYLSRENAALVLIGLGKTSEAAELAQATLSHYRAKFGERHGRTAVVKRILGSALSRGGDPVGGEALLREAIDFLHSLSGRDRWACAAAESDLADCLISQGRFDEAEALLVGAQAALQEIRGPAFVETQNALQRLVALYEKSGNLEKAQQYRGLLLTAQASSAD